MHEASEWIKIALICERLHVLPVEGGVFMQDEEHIERLLTIYEIFDDFRQDEIDKEVAKSKSK